MASLPPSKAHVSQALEDVSKVDDARPSRGVAGLKPNDKGGISRPWRRRYPRYQGKALSDATLRQKLKPHKHTSRQAMRDSMLADRRSADIAGAAERLSTAMADYHDRRRWADGVGFRRYLPKWYRRNAVEVSHQFASENVTAPGRGIDQVGKGAVTKTRTTVQRLALHRDRVDTLKRFRAAAQKVERLENGGENAAALHAARRELADLMETLVDIVETQRGRLADIAALDPGFDDHGAAADLAEVSRTLQEQYTAAVQGRSIGVRDALNAARTLGRLWGPNELAVLADISSPDAMREAVAKGDDPSTRRDRRFRAKSQLVAEHDRPEHAYQERLLTSVDRAGMAPEFERRALSARRDAVRRLREASVGAIPLDQAIAFDGKVADLEVAADRYTYHRRLRSLLDRQAHLSRQQARLAAEIEQLKGRSPDERVADNTPVDVREALIIKRGQVDTIVAQSVALGVEVQQLARSDVAKTVRNRFPGDVRHPPTVEELDQAFRDVFDVVKVDVQATIEQADDPAAVQDLRDAAQSLDGLMASPAEDLRRPDGTRFSASEREVDAVLTDWRAEVALETAQRKRAAGRPQSTWLRLGRKLNAALVRAVTFGCVSIDEGIDEIKGLTKLAAGATEATIRYNEMLAEDLEGAADAARIGGNEGGTEGVESQLARLEQSIRGLDEALNAIELVEHFAGAGATLLTVARRQKLIDEKREKQQAGREMLEDFQAGLEAQSDAASRARFQARHGLKACVGHALADQDFAMAYADQVVAGGQASRHLVQNVGRGMMRYTNYTAAGAALGVAGFGGAVVFEGGEMLLAAIEAHKAWLDVAALEKRLAAEARRVADAHGERLGIDPKKPVTVKALAEKLDAYENNLRGPVTDEDLKLRKDVRELQEFKAFVETLKSRKNLDEKIIVASRSGLATVGYAGAFMISATGGTGAGAIAAPIVMGAAGAAVLGTHFYRKRKQAVRNAKAEQSEQALLGMADPNAIREVHKQARKHNVPAELIAWELVTQRDPTRRATLLSDDLTAETQHMRLSDARIDEAAGIATARDEALKAWQAKGREVQKLKDAADHVVGQSAAAQTPGRDLVAAHKKTATAYEAAKRELDDLGHVVEAHNKKLADFEAARRTIFDPDHENYSKTAVMLRDFVGVPEHGIFAMIDAGPTPDDPKSARLARDYILGHMTVE